jgi:hypothetical protein
MSSTNTIATRVPAVPVVVQRVVRQLVQTLGPVILVVLTAPGATNDLGATALAVGWALFQTVVKSMAGLRSKPGDAWYVVVLDRTGSAAAGVVIGTGLASLTGLLTLDWGRVGAAALLAAVTSLLMVAYVPPAEPDPTPPLLGATTDDGDPGDAPRGVFQS